MATTTTFTDTFKVLADNYTETMKAGLKFQEDTARFWADLFSRNAEDMRNRFQRMTDEVMPFSKQNIERFHKLFDEQMNRGLDVMRDTFKNAQQAPQAETFNKMTDVWKHSFETMRDSVDTIAKANADLVQNWSDVVRTTCEAPTNGHGRSSQKAAATAAK